MNTIELTSILDKKITNGTDFLGVLACDQLSSHKVRKPPAMLIVNTHPSDMPGEHWLAIYFTKQNQGYFFDSFGNPPDSAKFSPEIFTYLVENCGDVYYSRSQVQNNYSTTCGQHCIFFLCHIQRGIPFTRVLNMYSGNLACNDAMVCKFVNKIQPTSCRGYNFTCVQCGSMLYNHK